MPYNTDYAKNLCLRFLLEWDEFWRWNKKHIATSSQPKVFYGKDQVLGSGNKVWGGLVKLQDIVRTFPNCPKHPNLLYLVSSALPPHATRMADIAMKNGAGLIVNQNGVASPSWCPTGWREVNASMAKLLHGAHHVFYQSKFCRMAADKFLGKREGSAEVLYNPVDTNFFVPRESTSQKEYIRLLLAGSHNSAYRVRTAIQTLSLLRQRAIDCRLIIAGRYVWKTDESQALLEAREMAVRENVVDFVEFQGGYLQAEAVEVFQGADILLHTQYNDSCPRLVVEAMACGLPVVYSDSGGVPELVGSKCGVGVPAPLDWEREYPPDPDGLAAAVVQVNSKRKDYSIAARERAVTTFNINVWVERHREVFESLLLSKDTVG